MTTPSIVFGRDAMRQGALGGRCEESTGEVELLILIGTSQPAPSARGLMPRVQWLALSR